jgi:lysozyme family protein
MHLGEIDGRNESLTLGDAQSIPGARFYVQKGQVYMRTPGGDLYKWYPNIAGLGELGLFKKLGKKFKKIAKVALPVLSIIPGVGVIGLAATAALKAKEMIDAKKKAKQAAQREQEIYNAQMRALDAQAAQINQQVQAQGAAQVRMTEPVPQGGSGYAPMTGFTGSGGVPSQNFAPLPGQPESTELVQVLQPKPAMQTALPLLLAAGLGVMFLMRRR